MTISVLPGNPNSPPINGLAILSTGIFNLQTDLIYSDATTGKSHPGGSISLVSNGDMTINATINSDGGNGKNGSDATGKDAGVITIASGGSINFGLLASISAVGGSAYFKSSTYQGPAGNFGDVEIYSNDITGESPLAFTTAQTGSGVGSGTPVNMFNINNINELTVTGTQYLAVPEPSSTTLLAGSVVALSFVRRRAA